MNAKSSVALNDHVVRSIDSTPGASDLSEAVRCVRELARRAAADPRGEHFVLHQELQYHLHYGRTDEATHLLRQWLASTAYDIDESMIPVPPAGELLPPRELRNQLEQRTHALSPLEHPLFEYLKPGTCTLTAFKEYLRQKFLIVLTFWRFVAELATRFARVPGENGLFLAAPLFHNVWDELGNGDLVQAHVAAHLRQLAYLRVPVDYGSQPEFSETKAYINNRLRCARRQDLAWALGSVFSQECISQRYSIRHFELLRHFGVPESLAQVYKAHDTMDADHAGDIMLLIDRVVLTAEQQAICLASLSHQLTLWNLHFDRVARSIGIP